MVETTYLQDWVNAEMLRGKYIFTKEDVLSLQLPISRQALQNSLTRMVNRGVIVSPWQNFYVTVPTEYRLRGEVPPSFYIDRLMKFLGRNYYVSLLTAAELNGASHQKAQLFQVTTNGKPIRSGVKNGTRLEFTLRQDLPLAFTRQVKTQTGYMNVSSPELTALDLIADENKIGGLSRAAEVLVELSETTRWNKSALPLLDCFSNSTVQRLGYLMEQIEAHRQANDLYALLERTGKSFRKTPFKPSVPVGDEMPSCNRWKIIENYHIEIDEI